MASRSSGSAATGRDGRPAVLTATAGATPLFLSATNPTQYFHGAIHMLTDEDMVYLHMELCNLKSRTRTVMNNLDSIQHRTATKHMLEVNLDKIGYLIEAIESHLPINTFDCYPDATNARRFS